MVAITKSTEDAPIVRKEGISSTFTLINLLNGMIGPGCFSVAMAFKQGGLWMTFFLVFFMGFVSTVSMLKITKCSQYLAKRLGDQALDYGDMAEAALQNAHPRYHRFATFAKVLVNASLLTFQIGVTSVGSIFVVEHVQQIFEHFEVATNLNKTELLLIYAIPKTILNFLRNIKTITYVCMAGNIFIFSSIAIILEEVLTSKWIWYDLPAVTNINGVSLAAGSLLYSFEGQAVVLPLENKLKHPQDMGGLTGVLSTGMSLVTIIFTYCGFFGYITYGNGVCGSITLNLPDNTLNVIVKIFLVCVVVCGQVLQLYVIIQMLWPFIQRKMSERNSGRAAFFIADVTFRIATVWVGILLAIAIPNLNQIIPLTGVTAGMMLSLIIPAVLDLIVFLPLVKEGPYKRWRMAWLIVEDGLIFLIGTFFLISGLQSNIEQLIHPVESC